MKTKEKAKELVEKFYPYNSIQPETVHVFKQAKQCALICVDEIFNNTESLNVRYWLKVKQEINKL